MDKSAKSKLIVLSTVAAVGLSATQIVVTSDELANPQPTARESVTVAPETAPVRVANTTSRRDRNG